jgi:hypothetical protein
MGLGGAAAARAAAVGAATEELAGFADFRRPSPRPGACAVHNTVVGTVVSASFLGGLLVLRDSAVALGFPCVVVQPFDWFDALKHTARLSVLPAPAPPLLPRSLWCRERSFEYGWRRSQLYRTRLWRVVLEAGLDLLAMDCDHSLHVSPHAFLRAVHAPPTPPKMGGKGGGSVRADVVAVWDGERTFPFAYRAISSHFLALLHERRDGAAL